MVAYRTPLYGHPLNTETLLLRTVFFVPGKKKAPAFCLNSTRLCGQRTFFSCSMNRFSYKINLANVDTLSSTVCCTFFESKKKLTSFRGASHWVPIVLWVCLRVRYLGGINQDWISVSLFKSRNPHNFTGIGQDCNRGNNDNVTFVLVFLSCHLSVPPH